MIGYRCALSNGDGIVQVVDITLDGVSIDADASVFHGDRGFEVVSGTTDTYLPRSMADGFKDAWEAVTGSVSCSFS